MRCRTPQVRPAFQNQDRHLARLEGFQPILKQLTKHPIDVHSAEAERIREVISSERTGEAVAGSQSTRVSRALSSSRRCAALSRASRLPMPTRCYTTIASSREAAHSTTVARRGVLENAYMRLLSSTSKVLVAVIGATLWSAVRKRTDLSPKNCPVSGNRRSAESHRATIYTNRPSHPRE